MPRDIIQQYLLVIILDISVLFKISFPPVASSLEANEAGLYCISYEKGRTNSAKVQHYLAVWISSWIPATGQKSGGCSIRRYKTCTT